MSLRAIKKRENQLTSSIGARQTVFKKLNALPQQRRSPAAAIGKSAGGAPANFKPPSTLRRLHSLQQQRVLLGRAVHSSPELRECRKETFERSAHLVRTKSDGDVRALVSSCTGNAADTAGRGLIGAKSEICLQSISSHSYQDNTAPQPTLSQIGAPKVTLSISPTKITTTTSPPLSNKMLSGARSHRDLSQSAYVGGGNYDASLSPTRRRMSECSLNSSPAYSQRTSMMSGSALTLSSSNATDPNTVVRVPIIGYEVMEERARFTVYKLRVENPVTNDCWLVLRRYTDFVRLNSKLKQTFPYIALMLPRKKIFGDNFNAVFLDNRVQGLQIFVNSIMAKEELRKCKLVREFFCLDEPPSYSESMEECRAIFEAQEETIAHLKLQINSKNDLILSLQQKLRDEIAEKEQLKEAMKKAPATCSRCAGASTSGASS